MLVLGTALPSSAAPIGAPSLADGSRPAPDEGSPSPISTLESTPAPSPDAQDPSETDSTAPGGDEDAGKDPVEQLPEPDDTTTPVEEDQDLPDKVKVPKPKRDVVRDPVDEDKQSGSEETEDPSETEDASETDEAEQADQADAGTTLDDGEMAELSAEYNAALEELLGAKNDLRETRAEFRQARAEERAAKRAHRQATEDLKVARAEERAAELEMASLERDLAEARNLLGAVARDAYSSGGSLASVGVLLQAETPGDFARRWAEVKTVSRAGDDALLELTGRLAGAAEAEAWYEGVVAIRSDLEAKTELELNRMHAAAELAKAAAAESKSLVQRRADAVEALESARADELAQYRAYKSSSRAVGASIMDISAQMAQYATDVRGTGVFVRPGYGAITSHFGPRFHPILHYTRMHTGTDFALGDGLTYAADQGTVIIAGYINGYGNTVVIDHGMINGQRVATLYAHHASLLVQPGDVVRKGVPIALVGSTGYSTGPHLHFEVRVDGAVEDPVPWLVGAQGPNEYRARVIG